MQNGFETSGHVGWLVEEIRKEHDVDVSRDPAALKRVKEAAKKADEEFRSGAADSTINLPFITATASGPRHFNRSVSRQQWNDAKGAVRKPDVVAPDPLERLAPPPRQVPISLAIVNALNWITIIGWIVFSFGSIYLWRILAKADYSFRSPRVLIITVFPIIGLSVIAGGLRTGRRRDDLLRSGVLAMGSLTDTRPTDPNLEDPDYEMTFEYTARDGKRSEAKVRTNDIFGIARLRKQPRVPLLFDSGDPSRAYLLDALAARSRIDEHGQFRGRVPAAAARLIPVVFILAAAVYMAVAR